MDKKNFDLHDTKDFYTIIEKGIDFNRRIIYFGHLDNGSDVDFSSINSTIRAIDYMVKINQKPITLVVSSFGGGAYEVSSLIDKMQETPVQFICYAHGAVMSAAVLLFCSADLRYASKNTTFLIHEVSNSGGAEKTTDRRIDSDEDERLQRHMESILADNSFMPKEFWEAVCRRDLIITPEEAKLLGLVDEIVPFISRKSFRKDRITLKDKSKKEITALMEQIYKRIKIVNPKVKL